jgi:excinuclease ABC subunit C
MFRLRTCEESVFANRSRPCLLFQIKRCSGPCVGHISKDDYAADVQMATMFLLGKQQEVTRRLTRSMEEASSRLAFEQAAIFRDQIQSLRQVQEKQFVSSSKGEDVDILVALKEAGQLCVNLAMIRGGRHLGIARSFPPMPGFRCIGCRARLRSPTLCRSSRTCTHTQSPHASRR